MGSKGSTSRPVSAEEKALWDQQTKSLDLADKVASEQWGLSQDDRQYFGEIFRGEVDPNSDEAKAAVEKALAEARDRNPTEEREIKRMTADEFVASGESNNQSWEEYNANFVEGQMETVSTLDEGSVISNALKGMQDKSVSVDTLLFDAVKSSTDDLGKALTNYADKSAAITGQFGADRTGISDKYTSQINDIAGTFNDKMSGATEEFKSMAGDALGKFDANTNKYQSAFESTAQQTSANMGQADSDILAQQRGQSLAGISQAYNQAQDQLLATMSRRGIAGSGVEAGALTSLYGQQAQAQAGALSQSYNNAIGLSDQRRTQQYGIASDVAQSGIGLSGQQFDAANQANQGIYGAQAQNIQSAYNANNMSAQTGFNVGMSNLGQMESAAQQLAATQYQGQTGNIQQGLANYQMASGVGQGVYSGASNMLAGAGTTANQSAQIAGQSAGTIANVNQQYAQMNADNSGGIAGAVLGMAGNAGAAYLGNTSVFKKGG